MPAVGRRFSRIFLRRQFLKCSLYGLGIVRCKGQELQWLLYRLCLAIGEGFSLRHLYQAFSAGAHVAGDRDPRRPHSTTAHSKAGNLEGIRAATIGDENQRVCDRSWDLTVVGVQ